MSSPLADPTSGRIFLMNGSAALPSLVWKNDGAQDTGFYRGGAGLTNITNNGVYSGQFGHAGNLTMVGTVAAAATTTTGNATVGGFNIKSITTGITAAGTTLVTATDLTTEINIVATVAIGSGVSLPSAIPGMTIIVNNTTLTALNVYPDVITGAIDSIAAGSPFVLAPGARIMFICETATQWCTLNATYF